jgi:hypothetical protein
VVEKDGKHVRFAQTIELTNRAGHHLPDEGRPHHPDHRAGRDLRQLPAACRYRCGRRRGLVGFQSENRLTNTGKAAWTRRGGLLSIWSMGMFAPSPTTT